MPQVGAGMEPAGTRTKVSSRRVWGMRGEEVVGRQAAVATLALTLGQVWS